MTTSAVSRRNFLCLSAGAAALATMMPLAFPAEGAAAPKLTWAAIVRARDIARANDEAFTIGLATGRVTWTQRTGPDGKMTAAWVDPFDMFLA